jgi:hypothetical protein
MAQLGDEWKLAQTIASVPETSMAYCIGDANEHALFIDFQQ